MNMFARVMRTGQWTALAVLLLFTPSARGTWNKLPSPFNQYHPGKCAFFFNELVGFVASDGVTQDSTGIFKTTDGGQTWIQAKIPTGYAGNFTSICMHDALNGWATIEEPAQSNGIYPDGLFKTTDGGVTWLIAGTVPYPSCVYQTPSAVVVTSRQLNANGSGYTSTDGGHNFNPGNLRITNGVDFCDALHGVATGFTDQHVWLRSQDGGVTWDTITPHILDESWGIYGVKGSSFFIAAGERDPTQGYKTGSFVYVSNDYGVTWTQTPQLQFRTTGHITGAASTIYVQETSDIVENSTGAGSMFRSTDMGQTWVAIGGPIHGNDTRFAVTGCNGGIVYAFDDYGNVWKTRDGGDGKITEPQIYAAITPAVIQLSSPICLSTQDTITFRNLYCANDSLLQFGFGDSSYSIVANGSLRFENLPSLPQHFGSGDGDSVIVIWDPGKGFHHDTSFTESIKIAYFSQVLNRLVDTNITISVQAIGAPPSLTMAPPKYTIDSVHACVPFDTSVTIVNTGCDTLFVLGADPASTGGFELLDSSGSASKFVYAIPPNDTLKFRLELLLTNAGTYASSIRLHLEHQGILRDTTIQISTTVPFENAYTFISALHLDTLSTCQVFDTLLTIVNPACAPFTVHSIKLTNGKVFSLPQPGILPASVASDGSWTFILQCAPTGSGSFVDTILINLTALGENTTISVPLSVIGTSKTSGFFTSLATPAINFPQLTRCDPPDSVLIAVVNPGCAALTITSATLEGGLAPVVSMTNSKSLPSSYIAGDTLYLKLLATPNALGNFSGDLRVQYHLPGGQTIDSLIPITASIIHGASALSLDTSNRNFDSITFCSTGDTTIIFQNTGCDSLYLTGLQLNGSGFSLVNQPTLPHGLAGGQKDTLHVALVPTQAGPVSGMISMQTDAGTNPIADIPLSVYVRPTDTLNFHISAADSVHPGDTTILWVYSSSSARNVGLTSIQFTLIFNGDLLSPVAPPAVQFHDNIPQSFVQIGPEVSLGGSMVSLPILIQALGPQLNIDSTMQLFGIVLKACVTDSTSTAIQFSDLELNGGNSQYQKCSLGLASTSSSFVIDLLCGDTVLVNFLRYGSQMSLSVEPVYPDPALSHAGSQVLLPYHTKEPGTISLNLSNERGERLNAITDIRPTPGDYAFDLSSLPSGTYFYWIGFNGRQSSATGKFVIVK